MRNQLSCAFLVSLVIAAVAGCGGSPSTSAMPTPPTTSVSIMVSCTPAVVNTGGQSQCSATVKGSNNTAVMWSASGGTIDSTGLLTAPASAGTLTVTATSTDKTAVSGQANVTVQLTMPPSKHVVMVMEENRSYSGVAGNSSLWPNLNNLIGKGALATNYYGDAHPSIGNYFMLTTGQLLTTNDSSTQIWNVDNMARRMLSSGVSFKVYAEGISQGYLGGDTGLYVIRHNPFAMLSDVANNPQVANQTIWPFTQFAADLANNALPEFSFIIPDLNDDAHNGTPQQADSWLQANVVSRLENSPAFASSGDGILIVDFDEGDASDSAHGGGHVAPVFWGPLVKAGYTQTSTTVYLHENMLRTVMDALGLQNPPGAAATAPAMSEFFVQK